ncbi:DNA-binding protein [Pokkaliibacter sp. MBI-7]|uniref:DNA-binding protein n=1 Tax=Pokkaliibacter sp. MBI-7 TaxID=3040600 RepID=UPI002449320A|nr:DNA-binding protein [Pokkaliibacter sp. MBI-7]MDH2434949.1 DNA-binding protein [Pokkaliibacter sp. MBI-7]
MSAKTVREQVFAVADDLLMSGTEPVLRLVGARLADVDDTAIQTTLQEWWLMLPQRIQYRLPIASDLPKEVVQVVQGLWDQAVRQASAQLEHERRQMAAQLEQQESDASQHVERLRTEIVGHEVHNEQLRSRIDELEQKVKTLQAELSLQKATLHAELQKRGQAEQRELDIKHELDRVIKNRDESRLQFESRLKDEQARLVEAQSRYKAEVGQMRIAHDQLRDDASKKDSALTRQIHELQAELARAEVKSETQLTQLKSYEQELKGYRLESASSSRDLSKLNAQLLTEVNKSKRFEQRIQELESAQKEVGKRVSSSNAETMRRESDLRQQVLEREDELLRLRAQLKQQQTVMSAREEEMKRLQARMQA